MYCGVAYEENVQNCNGLLEYIIIVDFIKYVVAKERQCISDSFVLFHVKYETFAYFYDLVLSLLGQRMWRTSSCTPRFVKISQ